jgi:hypothetical protein
MSKSNLQQQDAGASSDTEHYCLLCGNVTGKRVSPVYVREDGGANHGDVRAKGYICLDCLTQSHGWTYNRAQGKQ